MEADDDWISTLFVAYDDPTKEKDFFLLPLCHDCLFPS